MHRLHQMQERIRGKPKDVVSDYLAETMRSLNVQPGDVWSLTDVTAKVTWGRMRGLHRIHYHGSFVLEHMIRGETDEAAVYLTQLLRSMHQVCLENGSWSTAMHMLPRSDPLD